MCDSEFRKMTHVDAAQLVNQSNHAHADAGVGRDNEASDMAGWADAKAALSAKPMRTV
jgi:hypothetical protein